MNECMTCIDEKLWIKEKERKNVSEKVKVKREGKNEGIRGKRELEKMKV